MRKVQILILAGIMTVMFSLLVVVVMHKTDSDRIISRQEAEHRVQLLKAKIKVPIDEAMRRKIDTFTNQLERENEFMEIDGEKQNVSTLAIRNLRQIGEPAIPQLIDAAANHSDPTVRQYAVGIIHLICEDLNANVMEFLPVFVRSIYDKDSKVRGTAVSQIGQMASRFYYHKSEKELRQLIPYLVKGLSDKNYVVQLIAGETLFRIGRRDLVPEELIKKERWEHSS